jgi:hypothetical protein
MENTEKPLMNKHKEIMKDWNYDATCTHTSLPVSDLENLKCLIFFWGGGGDRVYRREMLFWMMVVHGACYTDLTYLPHSHPPYIRCPDE